MRFDSLLFPGLLVAISSGCSDEDDWNGLRWKDLSVEFEPELSAVPHHTWPDENGVPSPVIMDSSREGVWLEQTLPADSWTADGPGRWARDRPQTFVQRLGQNAMFQLVGPEGAIQRISVQVMDVRPDTDMPIFWINPSNLLVVQDPSLKSAPEGFVLREYVERGKTVGDRRRVAVSSVTAFGLDVWPGERAVREARLFGDSTLRFATACAGSDPETSAEFTIHHGEDELFRFEQSAGTELRGESATIAHAVDLPRARDGSVELTFAVEGDAHITAFLEPIVGPREIGSYTDRPWEETRPNLVYFSADTLRADGLSSFGGTAGRTPHLDRLAAESLRFPNTHSTSSWTLTSQVSMCTGLYPSQHSVTRKRRRLPDNAVTIAEQFEAAGYRTGAVTDSVFLSTTYALDQGFSWFEEHGAWYSKEVQPIAPLQLTLRNALDFLDRDDGRPVLLFIHTYRAHTPYRPDADENSVVNDELNEERVRRLGEGRRGAKPAVVLGDWVDRYRELYYEGVEELDTAFGPFWEQVVERGVAETSIFCFMSDHGEGFYEHGAPGHSRIPFEEQIHVPLFIRAPGLEPRAVSFNASLLDLPRTFAELAGIPPAPTWGGRSLLHVTRDEPVFAMLRNTWSVRVGQKKLLFSVNDEPKVFAAYDLSNDPHELTNLANEAAWPAELLSSLEERISGLRRPQLAPQRHELSKQKVDQLNSLGYAGD